MAKKYIDIMPPKELLESVEMIRCFPSRRNGLEFFELGENFLREQGLWPKIPIIPSKSILGYNLGQEAWGLRYHRRGFGEDLLMFFHFKKGHKLGNVSVYRERGYEFAKLPHGPERTQIPFKDIFKRQVNKIIIDEDDKNLIHEF